MGDVVRYAEVKTSGVLGRERLTAHEYDQHTSAIQELKLVLRNCTDRVLVVE
jgi:hypothetical protein